MNKKWTREEVELFDMGLSNKEIAEKTGRSVQAVRMKKYNMGVSPKRLEESEMPHKAPGELMQQQTKELRIWVLCKKLGIKIFG